MAPPVDVVTDDMPYLETLDRKDEQLEYVLSRSRIVIGSGAGCDIVVDATFAGNDSVAPRHAQLTRDDSGVFSITDLGAPSGTFVNDTRLEANTSAALSDGSQMRVGSVRFVYRVP
jgi:predicted component of type VI protein secretion system